MHNIIFLTNSLIFWGTLVHRKSPNECQIHVGDCDTKIKWWKSPSRICFQISVYMYNKFLKRIKLETSLCYMVWRTEYGEYVYNIYLTKNNRYECSSSKDQNIGSVLKPILKAGMTSLWWSWKEIHGKRESQGVYSLASSNLYLHSYAFPHTNYLYNW